jgi:phage tail sheath protein FI
MPEYLAPGVYVEERDTGNKPIEGVGTSTVGFAGVTERGPEWPSLITSWPEFQRVYGSYVLNIHLAYAVEGFFMNGGARCFVARVASHDNANPANATSAVLAPNALRVTAIGPGLWGNRIGYRIEAASLGAPLFKLVVAYWRDPFPAAANLDEGDRANFTQPALYESFDNLSANPASADYYVKRVNDMSNLVVLEQVTAGVVPNNTPNPAPTPQVPEPRLFAQLAVNGDDGAALTAADYQGDLDADSSTVAAVQRLTGRGIRALEKVDEVAILTVPDEHAFAPAIRDEVVGQCERLMDRFAILSSPQAAPAIANHRPTRASRYAGYYYPWINVYDPMQRREVLVPPHGHLAGIYARVDIARGVHKAPANEMVRGATSLQRQITKGQQDILNPRHVNCIREFEGRGILVWGAHCTVLDTEWKYINVRRLFIFVEESIQEGTQWVVFEPNDEPTWARVRRSVSDFLTRVWRDGALQGRTPAEAFFVRCDRTTMTQDDIDNGRLIMLIGIAPVKPAEFVIIRIGQWAGGGEVSEQ